MPQTLSPYKINKLKSDIIKSIASQGFYVNGSVAPRRKQKSSIKNIHKKSRKDQLIAHKNFLKDNIEKIQKYTLAGKDIDPQKIELELVEVEENTLDETIYKWWNLTWWSMPYQRAYGRQMRFVIWDNYHNVPFGLIGLQSPVLKMAVRDQHLDIPPAELDVWVNRSMQAQRVGALPPYNDLLGGKMVALTLCSDQIRQAYRNKYAKRTTLIKERQLNSNLLFISTSSAYGKSSIYNRLKIGGEEVAERLGYTKGFGTFHIPDSLFSKIKEYLEIEGINTETTFGHGPSKRIKLLYQAFRKLQLPNYSQHQIQREYYLFSHVKNLYEVIHFNEKEQYKNMDFEDIGEFWKERWCLPRSQRVETWKEYKPWKIINEIKRL